MKAVPKLIKLLREWTRNDGNDGIEEHKPNQLFTMQFWWMKNLSMPVGSISGGGGPSIRGGGLDYGTCTVPYTYMY